jgi:hypothetical protein
MRRKPQPLPNTTEPTLLRSLPNVPPFLADALTPPRPAPMDSGRPSLAVNDPMAQPVDLLSTVDPDTAISPGGDGQRFIEPQNAHTDLLRLRMKFPHLPIVPFPNSVKTVALQPNAPVDISLPEQAVLCRFYGNGEYYVSINGQASIPLNQSDDNSAQACMSVHKPEGVFFYLGNVKQISLIAPQQVNVTVLFVNEL